MRGGGKVRSGAVWFGGALVAAVLAAAPARAQFGLAISGVGPINRSMGGATVAAPIDSAGSLYWNPAAISGLPQSELETGVEIFYPRTTLSSRVPAGALGNGLPATNLYGNNGGNNGVFPLLAQGLVYKPQQSPWSFGMGIFTIGGFGVNYPASTTNPVLMPRFPFGRGGVPGGVGPLFSNYQVIQFAPTAAYQVTDELSVGVAPLFDLANLQLDPALFTTPALVLASQTPGPVYPQATHGRFRWGGGVQGGVFYTPAGSDWNFGASIKSPQWFGTYTFNSVNALGQPRSPKFNLNFPMIVSAGVSYTGIEKLLVALDVRYLNFRETTGFRHTGFDPTGIARGLGWQDIFALGLGAQYQATDALALRVGYTFAMNPVGDAVTSFNIASPTIIQHSIAVGFTYNITPIWSVSGAYAHDFQNQISGPLIQPFVGAIPGSNVRTAATADGFLLGTTVKF